MGEKRKRRHLDEEEDEDMTAVCPVTCLTCWAMSPVWLVGEDRQRCVICDSMIDVHIAEA